MVHGHRAWLLAHLGRPSFRLTLACLQASGPGWSLTDEIISWDFITKYHRRTDFSPGSKSRCQECDILCEGFRARPDDVQLCSGSFLTLTYARALGWYSFCESPLLNFFLKNVTVTGSGLTLTQCHVILESLGLSLQKPIY